MNRGHALAVLATVGELPPETMRKVLGRFPSPALRAIEEEWWWQAHGGQIEPDRCADGSEWRIWSIIAGRGFGKTRAGAEWVWQRARENPGARIALVAASLDDVAKVMVEGESGLLSVARSGEKARWMPSLGTFHFPSGAAAFAYTAERPAKLRGPQHHFAWCDELAKWPGAGSSGHPRADSTWDNLMLGLRLGEAPRTIVTTTPQPAPLLKRVLALKRSVKTEGRTAENPHLPADFREAVTEMYGGTRLGRQELDGMLFEEVEGALWTREMLERARVKAPLARSLRRVVVGVGPPASAAGTCGIIVCGIDGEGVPCVLDDRSLSGATPTGWARAVCRAAEGWEADLVVAEQNMGGDMVRDVLAGVDAALPLRLVSASRAKAARAEPVAMAFEAGRARIAGRFPALEDEMAGLTYAGGYEGPGTSPDRADAMVWAMSELMRPEARPAVRML